jgi:hypothetical protein
VADVSSTRPTERCRRSSFARWESQRRLCSGTTGTGRRQTTNRTEFLPDGIALAKDGVVSLLPQGLFPWEEDVTKDAQEDQDRAVAQIVQLRRGLDLLQQEAGDVAPSSVFLQFAQRDCYMPGYVADKLAEAASEPNKVESYETGHELNEEARKNRLAWLRGELGLD